MCLLGTRSQVTEEHLSSLERVEQVDRMPNLAPGKILVAGVKRGDLEEFLFIIHNQAHLDQINLKADSQPYDKLTLYIMDEGVAMIQSLDLIIDLILIGVLGEPEGEENFSGRNWAKFEFPK